MQKLDGLSGLRSLPAGCALSIGNFDGVHRGHQAILAHARNAAGRAPVAVATFEPHPLTVLKPRLAPPRLTPPEMKHDILASLGVEYLVQLQPVPEILGLSAERFWTILRDEVRPRHIVEGETFTFGKDRGGTIERLIEWSAGSGIEVHRVPSMMVTLLNMTRAPVSSSLIRWLITHGRVRDAAVCLGRPYTLRGVVIKGHQRGRTIGIPTANLDCDDQLVPADGVYAGRCTVAGRCYSAAVSIGTMPTFGPNARQIEAYLIGFDGDLYGRTLDLEILDWLREQRRFDGIDALKAAIAADLREIEARQNCDVSRELASCP